MSLRFYGGDRIQKGRGIGGLFRAISSLFSPVIRNVGKMARSSVGRAALKGLKKQGVKSASNIAADLISGDKSLKESLIGEAESVKKNSGNHIRKFTRRVLNKELFPKKRRKYSRKPPIKRRKYDILDEDG